MGNQCSFGERDSDNTDTTMRYLFITLSAGFLGAALFVCFCGFFSKRRHEKEVANRVSFACSTAASDSLVSQELLNPSQRTEPTRLIPQPALPCLFRPAMRFLRWSLSRTLKFKLTRRSKVLESLQDSGSLLSLLFADRSSRFHFVVRAFMIAVGIMLGLTLNIISPRLYDAFTHRVDVDTCPIYGDCYSACVAQFGLKRCQLCTVNSKPSNFTFACGKYDDQYCSTLNSQYFVVPSAVLLDSCRVEACAPLGDFTGGRNSSGAALPGFICQRCTNALYRQDPINCHQCSTVSVNTLRAASFAISVLLVRPAMFGLQSLGNSDSCMFTAFFLLACGAYITLTAIIVHLAVQAGVFQLWWLSAPFGVDLGVTLLMAIVAGCRVQNLDRSELSGASATGKDAIPVVVDVDAYLDGGESSTSARVPGSPMVNVNKQPLLINAQNSSS